MKTGIITFHASHNYGSMLQAYALQQTVESLGHDCEIINFRTPRQRRYYRPFYRRTLLRSKVKALLKPVAAWTDCRRSRIFERFLLERLRLSEREYASLEELQAARLPYSAIIAGSDQIWNTSCLDHDRAFFLPFAPEGCRRIAYAPSMGPVPEEQVSHDFDNQIRDDLARFAAISVREPLTADRIADITGRRPVVLPDPTLLLEPAEWRRLIPAKPLVDGDYIYLYAPWYDEHIYREAARLSAELGLPVVTSMPSHIGRWRRSHGFRFAGAAGPLEFLGLIAGARLVVSGSFHAAVFSLLLDRRLYAVDGMADARVGNLLTLTGLEHLAQSPAALLPQASVSAAYADARARLAPLRAAARAYLTHALTAE